MIYSSRDYNHSETWCVISHHRSVTWFTRTALRDYESAIKSESMFVYYVKYFDMDSTTLSPRELSLIPNLEGNRLTNDGKMAMKKGESDFPRDEREKGTFYWCACLFNTQNNNDDESEKAKNHGGVSCSSSYRLGIMKMTLFAAGFKQFINVLSTCLNSRLNCKFSAESSTSQNSRVWNEVTNGILIQAMMMIKIFWHIEIKQVKRCEGFRNFGIFKFVWRCFRLKFWYQSQIK